jgi:hypothetical protein
VKKYLVVVFCLILAHFAYAQEEIRIDITSFEEGEWSYSGNSIPFSFVEFSPSPEGVVAVDGERMLYLEYDMSAGAWNWASMNFPTGAIDLTGMREIHMSVYVVPGSDPHPTDGNYGIRLDLPGGANLGYRYVDAPGEWVELVWGIDRLTSDQRLGSVGNFGGFIMPGASSGVGAMYIDNIYAIRPAGIPDLEQVLVYGFNTEDPATLEVEGWTSADGSPPFLGEGDVPPSEGANYMEMALGSGWIRNIQTTNALQVFNRWAEVQEIMIDVRVSMDYTGGWVQSALILQSGVTGAEGIPDVSGWDGYPELGYGDAASDWKTILWAVDMSNHKGAFENEGGWFTISLTSNNDASQAGARIFFDNFRVSVPVGGVDVSHWNLY